MRKKMFLLLVAAMMLLLCSCGCKHEAVVDPAIEATCTIAGLTEGEHCAKCSQILKAQEIIPALGHTEATREAVEVTCTQDGLTEGKYCGLCGEVLTEQEVIPAPGHAYVLDERVAPTCTETGLEPGFHCEVCGEVFVPQAEIPADGHEEKVDKMIDSTCTEYGITEGKHCVTCGEILDPQLPIAPKGHVPEMPSDSAEPLAQLSQVDGISCTVCGEVFPFLTDEAAEDVVITEFEDGSSVAVEADGTWGLTRETVHDADGKLRLVKFSVNEAVITVGEYNESGELSSITLTVLDESGTVLSERAYSADGALADYIVYDYDADGVLLKSVNYAPDATEKSTLYYDYSESGETLRIRTLYPDGTAEYRLIPGVETGFEYAFAPSAYWAVTPYEVGLKAESVSETEYSGIVPKKNGTVKFDLVDYLTGEIVTTSEVSFGERTEFDMLLDGYYYLEASCDGFEGWSTGILCVSDCKTEEVMEHECVLVNPEAAYEDPVRICVVNENGKPVSRQTIYIGVTRNNSNLVTFLQMETNRDGYACFITSSGDENSSSDVYEVAEFTLREGCLLGYAFEDAPDFVPIVMNGSGVYRIQK